MPTDSINRLIREDSGDSWAEYSYDLAGNRTTVVSSNNQSQITNNYALGVGNRLSAWGTNGAAQYNEAGCITNLTAGDGAEWALQWNEKYQLTSVSSVSSVVNYSYDVLGRRTSRTVAGGGDPGSTNVEHYVYSGNQVVADLDENGNIIRSYTWGPGIDNLLCLTVWSGGSGSTPTATYYPLKDHQNSVLALTDESGTIAESYEYDAWGKVLSIKDGSGTVLSQSAIGNRYMWQGREYDSETGIYYFRARWYSPETGRWLSKDPIGISGGLNLYAFCGNNPVNFVDPSGLIWFQIGGAVIGGSVNAINNYDAYKSGDISGKDYAKSIVFGAGAGVLSTMVPGAAGVLVGGGLAGVNDAYNQSINSKNDGINLGQSAQAGAWGLAAGAAGNLGQSIGANIVRTPTQIGKVLGSKASLFSDYSDLGGLIGLTGGTLLSEGLNGSNNNSPCGGNK